MAAITVLMILLGIMLGMTNMTSTTIRFSSSKLDAFQTSQIGFDAIARRLSQATLNTYWDYDNATAPTSYVRKSDLHFLVLAPGGSHSVYFQTPGSYSQNTSYRQASGLLNACGYYVSYGSDDNFRPPLIGRRRWRYRLMQSIQPTEDLAVFSQTGALWTASLLPGAVDNPEWPLAENVIALIASPRESNQDDPTGAALAPNYAYDSRSGTAGQLAQLPPMIQLTMVVISEESALRLGGGSDASRHPFIRAGREVHRCNAVPERPRPPLRHAGRPPRDVSGPQHRRHDEGVQMEQPVTARAFTLIELLVVMAIVVLLAAVSVPAVAPMMASRDMAQAGQIVLDQIVLARQLASARNETIEVCLIKLAKGENGYSGIELRTTNASGATTPLTRIAPLPQGICIAGTATLSPLLNLTSVGQGNLQAGADNVRYVSFKVRSSGTVEPVQAGAARAELYLTLVMARYASNTMLPANFVLIQLNPDSGDPLVYRP